MAWSPVIVVATDPDRELHRTFRAGYAAAYRAARRMGCSHQDAEDAGQEAMLVVLTRVGVDNPLALASAVGRNKGVDLLRRRQRRDVVEGRWGVGRVYDPEDLADRAILGILAGEIEAIAADSLTKRQMEAFRALKDAGGDVDGAIEMLISCSNGLTRPAIRKRTERALMRLRLASVELNPWAEQFDLAVSD